MALNLLPVANEGISAESNVVKLEGLEESPVIEDMAMKKSSTIGDYHLIKLSKQYPGNYRMRMHTFRPLFRLAI